LEQGVLEEQGDLMRMRYREVRVLNGPYTQATS